MQKEKRKKRVKYPYSIGIRLNQDTYRYIEKIVVKSNSDVSSVVREMLEAHIEMLKGEK